MYLLKNERIVFAQFRCGMLSRRIETGRYFCEQLDDILSTFCLSGVIENEELSLCHVDF